MDARQLSRIIGFAAKGSLILLGSTAVLAGHRSFEQPTRPHMSAACSPNWGFNQTCWSRFPPVPGCPGSGCDSMPHGYENHPQQLLYTPQNSLLLPDSQIVPPAYSNSQAPVSVFSNSAPQAGFGGMPAIPAPNGFPQSVTQPQQFAPSSDPSIPDARSIPGSPVPGASFTLPPLPAPPLPAPGQSSLQPNLIMGPNRQMIARPVSALTAPFQTGSRYGNVGRSVLPATSAAPVSSVSFTNAPVANTRSMPKTSSAGGRYGNARLIQQSTAAPQIFAFPYSPALSSVPQGMAQVPVTLATQGLVLPGAAASRSYRSGSAMPQIPGVPGPQFQPTQLSRMANYPTIPAEPLRHTP